MARKILERIPVEMMEQDLERYRQKALDMGASDARVITADTVIIDDRVRAKCVNPKCPHYGTNANCPPHNPELETVRKLVASYHYGIFIKMDVPSAVCVVGEALKERTQIRLKFHEIIASLESGAFYDGYHLALGLAEGPCKTLYCPTRECSVLTGGGCRHPLKSRSAMEGLGMDALGMAARVGWDIYPIGKSATASSVPHGTLLGLVLIV